VGPIGPKTNQSYHSLFCTIDHRQTDIVGGLTMMPSSPHRSSDHDYKGGGGRDHHDEVEVEEGERAMMTSLTAITVGPPPAAAIMIAIDGAAVGRTDLSPPMTAVAIIAFVVTMIAVDGAADGGAVGRTDLTPPTTAVAIIAIVVTTIAIDGAAVGRTDLTPPTMFSRRC